MIALCYHLLSTNIPPSLSKSQPGVVFKIVASRSLTDLSLNCDTQWRSLTTSPHERWFTRNFATRMEHGYFWQQQVRWFQYICPSKFSPETWLCSHFSLTLRDSRSLKRRWLSHPASVANEGASESFIETQSASWNLLEQCEYLLHVNCWHMSIVRGSITRERWREKKRKRRGRIFERPQENIIILLRQARIRQSAQLTSGKVASVLAVNGFEAKPEKKKEKRKRRKRRRQGAKSESKWTRRSHSSVSCFTTWLWLVCSVRKPWQEELDSRVARATCHPRSLGHLDCLLLTSQVTAFIAPAPVTYLSEQGHRDWLSLRCIGLFKWRRDTIYRSSAIGSLFKCVFVSEVTYSSRRIRCITKERNVQGEGEKGEGIRKKKSAAMKV